MFQLSVLIILVAFNATSLQFSAGLSFKKVVESEVEPRNSTSPIITLERSECYGVCPAYTVRIFANLDLIYEGINYVKTKGKVWSKISEKQRQLLLREIEDAKYFKLRDSYADWKDGCTALGSDSPWAYTSIQISGETKTVQHYLGCDGGGSKFNSELLRLTHFENSIDEIVNIDQWIGTPEERKDFSHLKRINE